MDPWQTLLDVVLLLLAALALGVVMERLKQSAILGYLLAGTLLGPNLLAWVDGQAEVAVLAELGVALLLFTIGLEFSWQQLRRWGALSLGGGSMQVVITAIAAGGVALAIGRPMRAAVAIGAMVALSSTAGVLRVLRERLEIDSVHGRAALGILLLQDAAVVPLVLIVTALGGGGSVGLFFAEVAVASGLAGALFLGFYLLSNYVLPRVLTAAAMTRNRELPILLAVAVCLGAAWSAHAVKLSPALGAFVAGLLLAQSPFATQVRADVAGLRTLFVTMFFASIGMLAEPRWIMEHWVLVTAVVTSILVGKAVIIAGVVRLFGLDWRHALITGLALGQVGEFSFVLAKIAQDSGVLAGQTFKVIVSATVGTMFITPLLVAMGPRVVGWMMRKLKQASHAIQPHGTDASSEDACPSVLVIGYGPSGQAVVSTALGRKLRPIIIDLNPQSVSRARRDELTAFVGDACSGEMLEHAGVHTAQAVIITLPDHRAAMDVIHQVRSLAPHVPIGVRSRYHIYALEMMVAGAATVVDEETEVGRLLAKTLTGLVPQPARPPSDFSI